MVMRWNIQAIKFAIGIHHRSLIGLTKKHQQQVKAVQMNTHQLNQTMMKIMGKIIRTQWSQYCPWGRKALPFWPQNYITAHLLLVFLILLMLIIVGLGSRQDMLHMPLSIPSKMIQRTLRVCYLWNLQKNQYMLMQNNTMQSLGGGKHVLNWRPRTRWWKIGSHIFMSPDIVMPWNGLVDQEDGSSTQSSSRSRTSSIRHRVVHCAQRSLATA